MAYVDGEFDAQTRLEIEDWLANHPAAAADVEAQRRLVEMVEATRPAEPDEAAWAQTLASIETGLAAAPPTKWSAWRSLTRWLSAAAAVLLFLVMDRTPPDQSGLPALEPLQVMSAEDVEILSVHAADEKTLVVGLPPVQEPLDLAGSGDVLVKDIRPDKDGMVPYVHHQAGGAAPMIVAPLSVESNK
jgi:hypothetical protein